MPKLHLWSVVAGMLLAAILLVGGFIGRTAYERSGDQDYYCLQSHYSLEHFCAKTQVTEK